MMICSQRRVWSCDAQVRAGRTGRPDKLQGHLLDHRFQLLEVHWFGQVLSEAGVATTPGVDFDRARGAGTLRISFAGSTAEMEEAVRRLKAWRRA